MKKQILSCCLIIVLLFSGCSQTEGPGDTGTNIKWVPELASEEIKPYAIRVIEIIDNYLSFKTDWDETKNDFKDVFFRSEDLFTPDIYSADNKISLVISDLYPYKKTDAEYRYLRDVLCFYAGKPVSETVYPAEKDLYNYTEGYDAAADFIKIVDVSSIPFMSGTAHDNNSITLEFDQMNGVSVSDLQVYIEKVWGKLKELGMERQTLSVYYSCFEQSVFRIYVSSFSNDFYGCVTRCDWPFEQIRSDYWEKYTSEEQTEHRRTGSYPNGFKIMAQEYLYEFHSFEDLPKAISVASQFAGIE